MRSPLQFGSRGRVRNLTAILSMRFARSSAAFGQSAREHRKAIGNHAATEPPLVPCRFGRAGGASGHRRGRAAAGEVDVVIVGAGAAGIAAARRIAAAGRRYVLIEAADHIGGRCITDTRTFGVPYDRGAHWIHLPDLNPLTKLTPRRGIEIYPAPASQKVRIGLRNAREGELEDFLAAQVRATRAIDEAARKADVACEQALPNDLGDWRATSNSCSARSPRQGSGAAVGGRLRPRGRTQCRRVLPAGIRRVARRARRRASRSSCRRRRPRSTSTQRRGGDAEGHDHRPRRHRHRVDQRDRLRRHSIHARTCRSARSTRSAKLSLGSYDHIALELAGNPLGLDSDDLVFEKSADTHTAAILANVSGTPLCLIEVAGSFGRDLRRRAKPRWSISPANGWRGFTARK